ncbi:MAG: sugar ABC transporter permease [Candidatus Eisenbacteria bacterium]|nr:sugar ABC transporter permease [Candidatus Eisenbacteria bacterium]
MTREQRIAYAFAFPALAILGLVVLFPFGYNVVISLSNMGMKHFWNWRITGFQQYWSVFSEGIFYSTLAKTLIWTAINVFFHVVIGVSLALLLNRPLPGRAVIRTLLVLPWAVPQYITALTWRGMFHYEYGAVNLVLDRVFGLQGVAWLSQPVSTFAACLITNIWLGFPFMMIVALGGLQSIPAELYEAAVVDGASRWQRLWRITIPLLRPVLVPAISLGVIWTFNNFNVIWLVSNGGRPSDQVHILVSYVYRAAFNLYRFGYAAALSMVIFGILLLFSIRFIKGTKGTEAVY